MKSVNPYAQILAKILACLALILAPVAKADSLFTLQLGFSNHPLHDRYYESYSPDYYRYAYWPYFYSPEFYGSYQPYYYIYYPSYYHSFYYYRPVIPFYYAYFYPWYFYPYHGHHHRDRHYSLGPRKHHNHHDHHGHRQTAGAREEQQHYSVSPGINRTPGINYREDRGTNMKTGKVVMNNAVRGRGIDAPAGKKNKIPNIKNTGFTPRVTSSPAKWPGNAINRADIKIFQKDAVTRSQDNNYSSPANSAAPRGRHISPHRSPSITQSYSGPDIGHRLSSNRRMDPDRQVAAQSFKRSQHTPKEKSAGVDQQQSGKHHSGRRDDQGEAKGFGSSMRTHPRSKTR